MTQALWLIPSLCNATACTLGRQARAIVNVCLDQISLGERTATGSPYEQNELRGPKPEGSINLETYSCLQVDWPIMIAADVVVLFTQMLEEILEIFWIKKERDAIDYSLEIKRLITLLGYKF